MGSFSSVVRDTSYTWASTALQPRDGPAQEVELARRKLGFVAHQVRLHLDRPLLEHLPVPQLLPRLRRVQELRDRAFVSSPAYHRLLALLRRAGVPPSDSRARLGQEEPRERARKAYLLLLGEEVEHVAEVDCGDVATEGVERGQRGEVRAWGVRCGPGGEDWEDFQVLVGEDVPRHERRWERRCVGVKELVAHLPKACT